MTTTTAHIEKVDAVLALDEYSQSYTVEMSPEEAYLFTSRLDGYNLFDPASIVALIGTIDTLIPRMQFLGDNPNNGRMHHVYRVGREASRVMYLEIRTAYLPRTFDYERLTAALRLLARESDAQEADVVEHRMTHDGFGVYVFRFWWD